MREARKEPVECIRCGRCCLEPFFRHVSPADLTRWDMQGRMDLVSAAMEEKRVLDEEDSIMGLKRFKPCRFNSRETSERTACVIYETRPLVCIKFAPGRSRLCPQNSGEKR